MNPSEVTPLVALVTGLVTSIHCTAMCGPLACALHVRPLEYHVSRLLSYSLAGALCGAAGQTVAAFLQGSTARFVPWALVVVLVILGLGLEKRLPRPRFIASFLLRVRLNRSLGWLTPLLPCGPLWLMFGVAAIAGTWWGGALHMASFALGTIALPLLLQGQAFRLQSHLSPGAVRRTQQGMALMAASVLAWRASLPLHASCH